MKGFPMDMSQDILATIDRCARGAAEGTVGFGEIVVALATHGLESYRVDFREGTTTYFAPSGAFHVAATKASGEPRIGDAFDEGAILASIRASQRRELAYPAFVERAKEAGCVGYTVWITGRHVSYVGRRGEVHVERFPDALVF